MPASPKNRIFEGISRRLEQQILDGEVTPGDKLPSERELQERFAASRGMVREALRALEQKGLVDIRQGSCGGAFVKAVGLDQVSESLALLIRHRRVALDHLVDFREWLEGSAAVLAAQRATAEDTAELRRFLAAAARCLDDQPQGGDRFYSAELALHRKIVALAGNPLFDWVSATLHTNLVSYGELMPADPAYPKEALADWQEILTAMEQGRADRVGFLVRAHIHHFKRYFHSDPGGSRKETGP